MTTKIVVTIDKLLPGDIAIDRDGAVNVVNKVESSKIYPNFIDIHYTTTFEGETFTSKLTMPKQTTWSVIRPN